MAVRKSREKAKLKQHALVEENMKLKEENAALSEYIKKLETQIVTYQEIVKIQSSRWICFKDFSFKLFFMGVLIWSLFPTCIDNIKLNHVNFSWLIHTHYSLWKTFFFNVTILRFKTKFIFKSIIIIIEKFTADHGSKLLTEIHKHV